MLPIGLSTLAILFVAVGIVLYRRKRAQRIYDEHSITPEELNTLLGSGAPVDLYDVRLPLDVLVDSEIIAGAKRVSPGEIHENPALFPKDQDTIVYCTCPSDETSRRLVLRVREQGYTRVRFLRGGLGGWREAGFPVEAYKDSFELNSFA